MNITIWLSHPRVSCFRFSEQNVRHLQQMLPESRIRLCEDRETFLRALPETRIALVWQFEQSWFENAPRLTWIATPAAGKDYFRITPPPGVTVSYGEFHGPIMAETVLGMMLAGCRGILDACRLQNDDFWPVAALDARMRMLRGARVTILGFGRIGTWIGRYAKAFGAAITGIRRTAAELPDYFTATDRMLTIDALDDALAATDHLVLVLPRSPETDNIIDARRLRLLPESACLYNVGRGNAIDEAALADALRTRRLAGACLDVFQEEPLPAESPLRTAPGVLILPHASAYAPGYMDAFIDDLREKFAAAGVV